MRMLNQYMTNFFSTMLSLHCSSALHQDYRNPRYLPVRRRSRIPGKYTRALCTGSRACPSFFRYFSSFRPPADVAVSGVRAPSGRDHLILIYIRGFVKPIGRIFSRSGAVQGGSLPDAAGSARRIRSAAKPIGGAGNFIVRRTRLSGSGGGRAAYRKPGHDPRSPMHRSAVYVRYLP